MQESETLNPSSLCNKLYFYFTTGMRMKTQMFRILSFSLFFTLLLSSNVWLATAKSGQLVEQTGRIKPASLSPEASGFPAQKAADETLMVSEWISDTYQVFMPCISKSCSPLFADSFSDPGSGWLIENYTEYSTAYLNDEYQILVLLGSMRSIF